MEQTMKLKINSGRLMPSNNTCSKFFILSPWCWSPILRMRTSLDLLIRMDKSWAWILSHPGPQRAQRSDSKTTLPFTNQRCHYQSGHNMLLQCPQCQVWLLGHKIKQLNAENLFKQMVKIVLEAGFWNQLSPGWLPDVVWRLMRTSAAI